MRRTGAILNARLLESLSALGHGQWIVIADAGLPIPTGCDMIDLALVPSVPSFLITTEAIVAELVVERAVLAREMQTENPELAEGTRIVLGEIPVEWTDHERIKELLSQARLIVRTGECTPFANVVLIGGVLF